MNELNLVDIFFIITGSAVIIVTILLAIALFYIIGFVRAMKQVAITAQRATQIVSDDIAELSHDIKQRGLRLGTLMTFFKNFGKDRSTRKK
jgi:hypothetical protein